MQEHLKTIKTFLKVSRTVRKVSKVSGTGDGSRDTRRIYSLISAVSVSLTLPDKGRMISGKSQSWRIS